MPLAVCTPSWLGLASPVPLSATGVPATPPVEQTLDEYTVKLQSLSHVPRALLPVTCAESCTVEPTGADVTVAPCASLIAVVIYESCLSGDRGYLHSFPTRRSSDLL